MRILVVEDDRKIASFVTMGLKQAGFTVDHAANAEDALALTQTEPYDGAIVDIMLPGMDGLAMIEALRRDKIRTPVLILSAKRSVDDRVKGLQRGGDDYLTKPFAFSELLARRLGRFESATGGTIFPDEIGDLLMETEIALLRVLIVARSPSRPLSGADGWTIPASLAPARSLIGSVGPYPVTVLFSCPPGGPGVHDGPKRAPRWAPKVKPVSD